MSEAPGDASASRRNGGFTPETFSAFSRRLFDLTAGDSRSWVACAQVDSTSLQARRFLERCRRSGDWPPPPVAFVAGEQTAGRGRGARRWSSPPGLGLYLTLLLPGLTPATVRQLPLAFAILVARAVAQAGVAARIKWPNDILVGGRKLAGILLETSSRSGDAPDDRGAVALAGIGINVHHSQETLPLPGATSLALEGAATPIADLAFAIGGSVNALLAVLPPLPETVSDYRSLSVHVPGDHLRCRRGEGFVEGTFAGFDRDGALLLDENGAILRLASSEIMES